MSLPKVTVWVMMKGRQWLASVRRQSLPSAQATTRNENPLIVRAG